MSTHVIHVNVLYLDILEFIFAGIPRTRRRDVGKSIQLEERGWDRTNWTTPMIREWDSGHRHQMKSPVARHKQKTQRNYHRRRREGGGAPPRLKPLASSKSDPNMLLDPMVGPLLMAKPAEAEFLLSRNLETGSPYISHSKKKRRNSQVRDGKRGRRKRKGKPGSAQVAASAATEVAKAHSKRRRQLPPLNTGSNDVGFRTTGRQRQLFAESKGGVTVSNQLLNSNGNAEFRVVQAILKREHVLSELERLVSSSSVRPYFATDALYLMLDLRSLAVNCIEAIMEWRKPHAKVFEFLWEGKNYMLKLFSDTKFLRVCRPLGLLLGLPGIWNNPLLEFGRKEVEAATSKFKSPVAFLLDVDVKPSLDYDVVAAEKEKKNNGDSNQHIRRVTPPVMLSHAKHCLHSELTRLGLAHDRDNGKLITIEELKQINQKKAEVAQRARLSDRRKEFERLKRAQAKRDRRGENSGDSEDEKYIEKDEKTNTKSVVDADPMSHDSSQSSFAVRREALLKCRDSNLLDTLDNELKYLSKKLEDERSDVSNLARKARRLELSLRSMTQEGLISQAMTDADQKEASEACQRYSTNGDGNKLLDRLLTESSLQDFVGGWRLRKLREELEGAESRLKLLEDEIDLRKIDAKERRLHMDHVKLVAEKKKSHKMHKRQQIMEARAARLAQRKKASLTIGGEANMKRSKKKQRNSARKHENVHRELEDKADTLGSITEHKIGKVDEGRSHMDANVTDEETLNNMEDEKGMPISKVEEDTAEASQSFDESFKNKRNRAGRKGSQPLEELTFAGPSFPHASAIKASRSSVGRPPRMAAALMMHGGCKRIGAGGTLLSVVNNGVFLSRRVVEDPILRKRSLVAQKAAEKQVERNQPKPSTNRPRKLPPNKKPSLSEYAPYASSTSSRQPVQQKQNKVVNSRPKDSREDSQTSGSHTPNYLLLCLSHSCDYSKNLTLLEPAIIDSDDATPNYRGLLYSCKAMEKINFRSDGLITQGNSSSRPASVDTMNTIETAGTTLTTLVMHSDKESKTDIAIYTISSNENIRLDISARHKAALIRFRSQSAMPAILIAEALDIISLTRLCKMVSKAVSESLGLFYGNRYEQKKREISLPWSIEAAQRQIGILPLERRQIKRLQNVINDAAVDAREALAFSRASTRALQNVDASDGDALFLAFARRDVCARRCIDALKLLGIVGGHQKTEKDEDASMQRQSTTKSKHANKVNKSKSKLKDLQYSDKSFNGIVSDWDSVVASVTSFNKKQVGKAVLTGLRQLVRQLRVDVERRLKNISLERQIEGKDIDKATNDGEGKNQSETQGKCVKDDENFRAMRVAKIMGAWLSSLLGWHDNYYGKLESIERLSAVKTSLENKLLEAGLEVPSNTPGSGIL